MNKAARRAMTRREATHLARFAALMLALCMLMAASAARAETAITEKAQLNRRGICVGVGTGSAAILMVEQELPNAEIVYLNNADGYEAVALGKIDAYIYDRRQMTLAIQSGRKGVHLLDEDMEGVVRVAAGISPVSHIPDLEQKINAFLAEIREDGTLDDMFRRWVEENDTDMPDIPLPENPSTHLVVGTSGTVPPFSYYVGTELSGYDIEMARRFAAWLDADVAFKVYDYGAIINAAASGDVDIVMSNLNITPEREEALTFSDVFYALPVAIMVRGDPAPAPAQIADMDAMDGKRIGVQTGTTAAQIARERLPHIEISEFSTFPDMAVALKSHKIDGFLGEGLVLMQMAHEDPALKILDERLRPYDCGFVLAKSDKGRALGAEINAWLKDMRARGELDRLLKKWTESPEAERTIPDYRSFPAPKGILTLATEGTYPPMNYYRGEACVGMEIELTAMFCEACGYGLNVETMDFGSGMLMAVQTGKVDFAASGIAITEERRQSVDFSDPYFSGGMTMAVLKGPEGASPGAADSPDAAAGGDFLGELKASYEKTFLRENRWQLFGKGVLTTLLITLLSILLGTALGFAVFMLCRNGNPAANLITRFCLWLVRGMPMVVLLMILYYVVFGSVSISGALVAVIGFTLTFGAAVFGLLKMGVGAVDPGQYEAAYALGYSNRRTFFRIILPQALPHVMSAYMGEIVALIKATAVVGYIAVQDLTKMGDIVRSRTYEAFFPLIAVTVIYFALEAFIKLLFRKITIHLDFRRRRPEEILKGVKTDDQN